MTFLRWITAACVCYMLGVGNAAAAPFDDGWAAFNNGDYAQAIKIWGPLAAGRDVDAQLAQLNLGKMYFKGEGVPLNYQEAMKWFRLAAARGNANAEFLLGMMYEDGQGAPQNYQEAMKWYRLAAAHGEAKVQNMVGGRYADGKGVAQSYTEAVKWYRLAAAQGYASAQLNLGLMYAQGKGVPQDYVRAHMWFNLSAALGNENGIEGRDLVTESMTSQQIAKAQEMASDCQQKNFKGCN